jgi:hypothetical protein
MPTGKLTPRSTAYHSKLAKAETLLVLALLTDLVINPWLFSQPSIPLAAKTLIKMGFIVGMFGPVQSLLTRGIERLLKATRTVKESVFSLPRMLIHTCILGVLFMSFFWSMYHRMPWADVSFVQNRTRVHSEAR